MAWRWVTRSFYETTFPWDPVLYENLRQKMASGELHDGRHIRGLSVEPSVLSPSGFIIALVSPE